MKKFYDIFSTGPLPWYRWCRVGGGWFVGLRWHSASYVANSRFKLCGDKFIPVPPHHTWNLDIGFVTHMLSLYFRKEIK